MTCIVAITDGETVLIGGDSAGVGGSELRVRADAKVFQVGQYGIGFTTSFRMGQILRYQTDFPEPPPGAGPDELERFIVTELIDAVRRSFKEQGFAKKVRVTGDDPGISEEGQDAGGLFLVGVAGQIFEIRKDYQLARPAFSYSSIGSAAQVALGALYALETLPDLSMRERAERALDAAESYTSGVRKPFHFIELGPS